MEVEAILQRVWELVAIYGIKVIAAIAIFVVGRWIAKGFRKLVRNVMGRRKIDKTIIGFVANLTYVLLLTLAISTRPLKLWRKFTANDERVLKDPATTIAVVELADSSVNFVFRPWSMLPTTGMSGLI